MEEGWSSGISPHLKERIGLGARLGQVKEAFEAQRQLNMRIDRMKGERLTDLSLIPRLYDEYNRIALENGFRGDVRNDNHKQFLMVLLLLYCPDAIFRGQIRRDFCMSVVKLLGLKSRNSVYNMRDKGASWYALYPQFSAEVDLAYNEIVGDIEKEKARK